MVDADCRLLLLFLLWSVAAAARSWQLPFADTIGTYNSFNYYQVGQTVEVRYHGQKHTFLGRFAEHLYRELATLSANKNSKEQTVKIQKSNLQENVGKSDHNPLPKIERSHTVAYRLLAYA